MILYFAANVTATWHRNLLLSVNRLMSYYWIKSNVGELELRKKDSQKDDNIFRRQYRNTDKR